MEKCIVYDAFLRKLATFELLYIMILLYRIVFLHITLFFQILKITPNSI